jgi:alkylation response protein AidB-like acyl-CoA dehydrogenase
MTAAIDIDDRLFLLKNVLQVSVLTYADAFKAYGIDDFMAVLREGSVFADSVMGPLNRSGDSSGVSYTDQAVLAPDGFQKAWRQIGASGWIKICAAEKFGGRSLPNTVGIAVQEAFCAANPALYFYLLSTVETARLIEQHSGATDAAAYCRNLYDGIWTGAFALSEPGLAGDWNRTQTKAVIEGERYHLSGVKSHVVAGSHDLSTNQVHIVLARVSNQAAADELGLFYVPFQLPVDGGLVDNHVRLESITATNGIKGVPFCTISYGRQGTCRGYRLTTTENEHSQVYRLMEGFRLQMALLGVAQLERATAELQQQVGRSPSSGPTRKTGRQSQGTSVSEVHLLLKALSEGTRAAVYSAAFFSDCKQHGAEQQKRYFDDLLSLYCIVLKVYQTETAVDLIQSALQSIGCEGFEPGGPLEQILRDTQSGPLLGGVNEKTAEQFFDEVLARDDGRLFQHLMQYFQMMEMHLARSEALNEATLILKDYIGGLIVLFDDLMAARKEYRADRHRLHAGRILRLFGTVIVCFHLVQQGLAAETALADAGINFYNLRNDVLKQPECRPWYNKLIAAEYFALHVLSLQEGSIRLIQRNPSSVADFLSETEPIDQ